MDVTARTPAALVFDNTSVDTAAASVVQALVVLQQALADAHDKNPMSPMTMVQMAAAATGLALQTPIAKTMHVGDYSPELTLTFVLAPIHKLANIELTVPAIGPDGANGEPNVALNGVATEGRAIDIFSRLWLAIHRHVATLVGQ